MVLKVIFAAKFNTFYIVNEVQFIGERLIYGNLGHLAVVVSFGTAIIATFAYLFAANNPEENSWQKNSNSRILYPYCIGVKYCIDVVLNYSFTFIRVSLCLATFINRFAIGVHGIMFLGRTRR